MSERDDVPAAEETRAGQRQHLSDDVAEDIDPDAVDPVDPVTAARGFGAGGFGTSGSNVDSAIPQGAPDPSIGPD